MIEFLLAGQLVSTLGMLGVIWFVQVVHYPLFAEVGAPQFPTYERLHQLQTTLVVAPLMLLELSTSIALLGISPYGPARWLCTAGLALLAIIWASTYWLQVPAHQQLSQKFDASVHRFLVRSNWIRTVAWTVRSLLVCWMCLQWLASPAEAAG